MNVTISELAKIAIQTLDSDDRRYVHAWIDLLQNWENDPFVRERSRKLADETGNLYVLLTSSDIRLFFKVDAHQIEVIDVARKAGLESFRRNQVSSA